MEKAKVIIKDLIIVIIIVFGITFFIKPVIVKQTSMLNTLTENSYVLINKQAYTFSEPKQGDIIVFPVKEGNEEKLFVKRIIGLPGEEIDIKNGKVYINNKEIKEDYLKDGYTNGEIIDYIIPQGEVFVMGDNRLVSVDSRSEEIGSINVDNITGKALLRVFPFKDFGLL